MPPKLLIHEGRIYNTQEWKIIYALSQSGHCFAVDRPRCLMASGGSKTTRQLRNAVYYLDVQIRRTFTALKLDVLLYLELEGDDDEFQTMGREEWLGRINSDLGEDSNDDNDTSSQSSLESSSIASSDKSLNLPSGPSSSSTEEALHRLQDLCCLLEARVNRVLIPITPERSGKPGGYPRLSRLVNLLQGSSVSEPGLYLIPGERSMPDQFLFNIAEDEATADAFVAFTDPEKAQPDRETRQRLLQTARSLATCFYSFNSFVDMLQFSATSLDELTEQSSESSAASQSFPSFILLQRFRQQTSTAYQTMMSHVSCCTRTKTMKHKILVQLPGWDDISRCDSRNTIKTLHVPLFFTICPRNSWQFARMSFLLYVIIMFPGLLSPETYMPRPEHSKTCRQRKLFKVLNHSHDNDMDLEFFVSKGFKTDKQGEILIHVPIRPQRTRKYGKDFPNHEESLRDLIKRGYFAKERTLNLWHITNGKGTAIGVSERKSLAIKLILGFMMSMDSDYVIESWDPKHVHFLKPVDAEHTPFVSISDKHEGLYRQSPISLTKLSSNLDGDEDDPKPLPQFALLAKALLQISFGEYLGWIKIPRLSGPDLMDTLKSLRRKIESYSLDVACGPIVDREPLPFLQAALGCLDFHLEYQTRMMETQSRNNMDLAWKVVFDTILTKIDSGLTLKELLEANSTSPTEENPVPVACSEVTQESAKATLNSSTGVSCVATVEKTMTKRLSIRCVGSTTPESGQHIVQLFDTKKAAKPSTAHEFWALLDQFHKSYSSFVCDRQPEVESARRTRIAILDTGIDFRHTAMMDARIKGRVKEEWCYSWVGDKTDAGDDDDELHGTNCASLLHKVAPEADIYICKVFKQNNFRVYEAENIAKPIRHAVDVWEVDVISLSFGLRRPTAREAGDEEEECRMEEYNRIVDAIEEELRYASAKPTIIFAAASNSGKNVPRTFPASYQRYVIGVHASEGNGEDGGINPETENRFNLMTLGMGIEMSEREWVAKCGHKFAKYKTVFKSGTSFATPIAAGIAATVLDLAARVKEIDNRVKTKLRRYEEMEKILRIMSIPKKDVSGRLSYMAPWHHWESGWEMDKSRRRLVWDSINVLFQ